MKFLIKFLYAFVLNWLCAVIAMILLSGGWHYITKRNFDIFHDEMFLFGVIFLPILIGLIIGLARAFGWRG